MFVKAADGTSKACYANIANLTKEMGIVENVEKGCDFAEEQKYLGFINFLQSKSHRHKEVERLAGRLNHTAMVLPQMRCNVVDIYAWNGDTKKIDRKLRNPQRKLGGRRVDFIRSRLGDRQEVGEISPEGRLEQRRRRMP